MFCDVSQEWSESRDAGPLDDLTRTSWYVLHPQGDFIIRSAWFDTLFGDSIPVVFDSGYVHHLPFADILDYSQIMATLPAVGQSPDKQEFLNHRITTSTASSSAAQA